LGNARAGDISTDLFVPIPAVLTGVRDLTATEKLFALKRKDALPLNHEPGQFVQVSIFGLEEAPISVCSAAREGEAAFELCVRRAGKLTGAMHELRAGEEIGIRGPFGRGFPLADLAGKELLFVAGGIGLAPMRSLIQHCLRRREDFAGLTLLYGAKQPAELLFRDELDQWAETDGFDVRLIVDVGDAGWPGPVGLITELIPPLRLDPAKTAAALVGPPVMYRYVIEKLRDKHLRPEQIFLSLERHMRCGVGKCGHCIIGAPRSPDETSQQPGRMLYCCRDGPVFALAEVMDLEGAL
jgi:NAD(P)H-flavin reductase